MLTTDKTQKLAAEGALEFLREYGADSVNNLTLLEFLVTMERMLDRAISSGNGLACQYTADRHRILLHVAGLCFLALQHHGTSMYLNYELKRALHPQHAERRSLLMENQFVVAEATDLYKQCRDEATQSPEYNEEAWTKFKSILQRLGLQI